MWVINKWQSFFSLWSFFFLLNCILYILNNFVLLMAFFCNIVKFLLYTYKINKKYFFFVFFFKWKLFLKLYISVWWLFFENRFHNKSKIEKSLVLTQQKNKVEYNIFLSFSLTRLVLIPKIWKCGFLKKIIGAY